MTHGCPLTFNDQSQRLCFLLRKQKRVKDVNCRLKLSAFPEVRFISSFSSRPVYRRFPEHLEEVKDTDAEHEGSNSQAGEQVPPAEHRGVFLPVVELLSAAEQLLLSRWRGGFAGPVKPSVSHDPLEAAA